MESKEEGGIFDLVREFCMSQSFEADFEAFAAEHLDVFADAVDMKEDDEHRLEYHDVYQRYLDVFEGKIKDFIEAKGKSVQEFQQSCRHILEGDDEYGPGRFFVEALLATTEYPVFLSLMKGEARRLRNSGGK